MKFIFNFPFPAFVQKFIDRHRASALRTTTLTFKGWKDPAMAEKFHDSLGFYEIEIAGRRAPIGYPKGILQFFMHNKNAGKADVGSSIDVLYFPDHIAREYAKKFFDEAGLIVE